MCLEYCDAILIGATYGSAMNNTQSNALTEADIPAWGFPWES